MAGIDFTNIGGGKEMEFAEKGFNLAFSLQNFFYGKAWFGENEVARKETQETLESELTQSIFPEIAP